MFDSHCHINDDALFENRKEILLEAKNEFGVNGFLCVGWDIESSKKALQIANEFPFVYAAVGIHPENLEGVSLADLDAIEGLAKDPKVKAIGEIGLDYHWEKDPLKRKVQQEFFIRQIELANKLRLPVTIHARDATQDTFDILNEHPINSNFSLHCYSGSLEMMKRFVERFDCFFGFDGPITYKNASSPKENVAFCPPNRLLLETDSPYLPPVPHRGKMNKPSYLPLIMETASLLRGIPMDELVRQTDENACRLFHVELK